MQKQFNHDLEPDFSFEEFGRLERPIIVDQLIDWCKDRGQFALLEKLVYAQLL